MKKIKFLPILLIAALLLAALGPGALAAEEGLTPPEISSAAAAVLDMDTGRALYELNADAQRYPASLTKVVTVLLAVEAIERGEAALSDTVTAGDAIGVVSSDALAEISQGAHLHLELSKDGVLIDPEDYITALSSK